ncbi:NUDIX domain-containing protein [Candidatus Uhrbacteria bacterium]|nr:NUDIX domain-containing protein [Candidatus Uhrbacteria bacterium]
MSDTPTPSLALPALRKGVDHVGVAIVYFCHDGSGRFLMSKRNANTRDEHGCWDIGGGALEHGITVEETIRKEIREEYCTDVLGVEFLGYRDVHRVHEGRPTHWIGLDFNVRIDSRTVANGEPHKFDAVTWFTLDALPTPVHSQLPTFLEKYRTRLLAIPEPFPAP